MTTPEPLTPSGETWRCVSCHDTTAPMGMCQKCGVFGTRQGERATRQGAAAYRPAFGTGGNLSVVQSAPDTSGLREALETTAAWAHRLGCNSAPEFAPDFRECPHGQCQENRVALSDPERPLDVERCESCGVSRDMCDGAYHPACCRECKHPPRAALSATERPLDASPWVDHAIVVAQSSADERTDGD